MKSLNHPGAVGNLVVKMTGTNSIDSVNKPDNSIDSVNKPDYISDAETSVSGEAQSGSKSSNSQGLTESHNNAVNSLIDRVTNLDSIPGNEYMDIIQHIKDSWNPMGKNRDAEAEVASSEFIDSLKCFTNLRSRQNMSLHKLELPTFTIYISSTFLPICFSGLIGGFSALRRWFAWALGSFPSRPTAY